MIIGKLEPFFETGTEGIVWSVYEDGKTGYDGLNGIEDGDYLTVFDPKDKTTIIWEGHIDFDWEINFRPYPANPEHGQQSVGGYWVHGLQRGLPPEQWATWFFNAYPATLHKANMGKFTPTKSSTISGCSWKGTGGLYNEGTSGDLFVKFKNGGYYRYKDVDPKTFWALYEAPSIGKFFAQHIKDKFVTEKITLTKI